MEDSEAVWWIEPTVESLIPGEQIFLVTARAVPEVAWRAVDLTGRVNARPFLGVRPGHLKCTGTKAQGTGDGKFTCTVTLVASSFAWPRGWYKTVDFNRVFARFGKRVNKTGG
jgi:hypothetical protein